MRHTQLFTNISYITLMPLEAEYGCAGGLPALPDQRFAELQT
jgi:hypothetical protein